MESVRVDSDLLGLDGVALAFGGRPRPLDFVGLGSNESLARLPVSSVIFAPLIIGLSQHNECKGNYARLVAEESPLLVFRFRGDVVSGITAPSAFRFGGIAGGKDPRPEMVQVKVSS